MNHTQTPYLTSMVFQSYISLIQIIPIIVDPNIDTTFQSYISLIQIGAVLSTILQKQISILY